MHGLHLQGCDSETRWNLEAGVKGKQENWAPLGTDRNLGRALGFLLYRRTVYQALRGQWPHPMFRFPFSAGQSRTLTPAHPGWTVLNQVCTPGLTGPLPGTHGEIQVRPFQVGDSGHSGHPDGPLGTNAPGQSAVKDWAGCNFSRAKASIFIVQPWVEDLPKRRH